MADLKVTTNKTIGVGTTVTVAGGIGYLLDTYARSKGFNAPEGVIPLFSTTLITAIYTGIKNIIKHRKNK
jgi:hypothetical protein